MYIPAASISKAPLYFLQFSKKCTVKGALISSYLFFLRTRMTLSYTYVRKHVYDYWLVLPICDIVTLKANGFLYFLKYKQDNNHIAFIYALMFPRLEQYKAIFEVYYIKQVTTLHIMLVQKLNIILQRLLNTKS